MIESPICGIYSIKNLMNGKYYIGQSIDIHRRWIYEKCKLNSKNDAWNVHLQSSWRLYGEENFQFSVIEECSVELLDSREQFWINFYDSFHNGYNQNIGGGSNRGYKPTEETRKKISQAVKNTMTAEKIEQISKTSKSFWKNPQRRKDMSKRVVNWWNETDNKERMSGKNSWAYRNPDGTYSDYPVNVANNTACVQVETGNYYYTITEASRQTGIPRGNIRKACHGERKTAGGYCWRLATEEETESFLHEMGVAS